MSPMRKVVISAMHVAVLRALAEHEGDASEECLAELTGLSVDTVVRILRDLAVFGLAERTH